MTAAEPQPPPLRILVVDADERVRESLAGLLAIGRQCVVVGTAGHPEQALVLLDESTPDVIVLDPRLPDVDAGRVFIARARQLAPGARILVMGWTDALEDGAIAAAADAFIRKTFRPRELLDAVLAAGAIAAR